MRNPKYLVLAVAAKTVAVVEGEIMLGSTDFKSILSAIFGGLFISFSIGTAVVYHHLWESNQRAREIITSNQTMISISETPALSQSSIEKAVEMYNIQLPEAVKMPLLDLALSDRGMTVRKGAMSPPKVTIGPDAFASWGLLGSTIAHEVEVHCRQNFFAIHLMDLLFYILSLLVIL